MSDVNNAVHQMETTTGSLISELQIIWDEVGETEADRDKMLLELGQECLEVYRRKVDQANQCRAELRQTVADYEAELATTCSAMGERPVHIRQSDRTARSLKEEIARILPQVEEMQKRKSDRTNQFVEVLEQIHMIKNEIYGSTIHISSETVVDEADLSLRKLEEFHRELHDLQKEKSGRLKQVQDHLNTLRSLCSVLGMGFKHLVSEVHPTFGDSEGSKSISNDTIERLTISIRKQREVKIQRMQMLQDLATTMLELWNLMDTPVEEQQMFQRVTCNIAASEHEITEPNTLSVDFINYVEAEVSRLEELKSSKMKELVLKKRLELEEICRKTHMVPENDSSFEYAIEAIESGGKDPANVLEQIEFQIAKVKEEAFSRKEILERVEKWFGAREEECWLEEYNMDGNRYNAGKGAHLILKRAEKARSLVNKLPGMVEALVSKAIAWEKERGAEFLYDGVRLLSMLEEYTILRQEKEQERRRQRDQKKIQGQLIAEQEVLYGSKPSPLKVQSVNKLPRISTGAASSKKISGGVVFQTPKPDLLSSTKVTPQSRPPVKKIESMLQHDHSNLHLDDGFTVLSAGRRDLEIAGIPIKKHSLGAALSASEPESPMMRKPFSPISCTTVSKFNINNLLDDLSTHGEMATIQKTVQSNDLSFTAPLKTTTFVDDENMTPMAMPIGEMATIQKTVPSNDLSVTAPLKTTTFVDDENMTPMAMPIPIPPTPSTVSVLMRTAITPAPAPAPVPFGTNQVEETAEEIEYSFEERRAGFVLPKTYIKAMIQV